MDSRRRELLIVLWLVLGSLALLAVVLWRNERDRAAVVRILERSRHAIPGRLAPIGR
jgi:hypothetical protein